MRENNHNDGWLTFKAVVFALAPILILLGIAKALYTTASVQLIVMLLVGAILLTIAFPLLFIWQYMRLKDQNRSEPPS